MTDDERQQMDEKTGIEKKSHKSPEKPLELVISKELQDFITREVDRRVAEQRQTLDRIERKAEQHEEKYTPPSEDIKNLAAAMLAHVEATKQLTEQTSRTIRHSNAYTPEISAYSYPEGNVARPKPILSDKKGNPRETFFCGIRQEESLMTPEEILAFNRITTPKTSRGGTWRADIQNAGMGLERLLVQVPNQSINERMELPSGIRVILLELEAGQEATDPLRLTEEIQKLQATVAQLIANQQKGVAA